MAQTHNQEVGKFGEMLAKKYLISHGYKIIGCNIKTSYKEIDIIAQKDQIFVFVEVKTRISQIFGSAEEALQPAKLINFKKAIEYYLYARDYIQNDVRADLICLDIDRHKKTAKIKHYHDII